MPTCKQCGFWDATDAEFNNAMDLCLGCTCEKCNEHEWKHEIKGIERIGIKPLRLCDTCKVEQQHWII